MRETLDRAAPSASTVLLLGETGTGKEQIAHYLHDRSTRKDRFFLAVECTSLIESLAESVLFGNVKGAFTGATQNRPGHFRSANGGTVFLDEIGELPLSIQPKLLRVLQEGEVTPVGASKPEHVDLRFVLATHRNLEEMVRTGRFREDLYHRISVIQVNLPPLRQRPNAIPLLAKCFLRRFNERDKHERPRGFSECGMRLLERHAFRGNVRELGNVVEKAVVLHRDSEVITAEDLDLSTSALVPAAGESQSLDRYLAIGGTLPGFTGKPSSFQSCATGLAEQLWLGLGEHSEETKLKQASRRLCERVTPPADWFGFEVLAYACAIVIRRDVAEHWPGRESTYREDIISIYGEAFAKGRRDLHPLRRRILDLLLRT